MKGFYRRLKVLLDETIFLATCNAMLKTANHCKLLWGVRRSQLSLQLAMRSNFSQRKSYNFLVQVLPLFHRHGRLRNSFNSSTFSESVSFLFGLYFDVLRQQSRCFLCLPRLRKSKHLRHLGFFLPFPSLPSRRLSEFWLAPSSKIATQVARYMLHAATDRATLRKVEDCSTYPATRPRRCVTRAISSATCLTIALRCKLQEKLPRVTGPLVSSTTAFWALSFSLYIGQWKVTTTKRRLIRSWQRIFKSLFFLLQDDWTPLPMAAQNGHTEVVTKLLESGADHGVKGKVWSFDSINTIPMDWIKAAWK